MRVVVSSYSADSAADLVDAAALRRSARPGKIAAISGMVDNDASAGAAAGAGEEASEMHAVVPSAAERVPAPRGLAAEFLGGQSAERRVDLLSDRLGELRGGRRFVETGYRVVRSSEPARGGAVPRGGRSLRDRRAHRVQSPLHRLSRGAGARSGRGGPRAAATGGGPAVGAGPARDSAAVRGERSRRRGAGDAGERAANHAPARSAETTRARGALGEGEERAGGRGETEKP